MLFSHLFCQFLSPFFIFSPVRPNHQDPFPSSPMNSELNEQAYMFLAPADYHSHAQASMIKIKQA